MKRATSHFQVFAPVCHPGERLVSWLSGAAEWRVAWSKLCAPTSITRSIHSSSAPLKQLRFISNQIRCGGQPCKHAAILKGVVTYGLQRPACKFSKDIKTIMSKSWHYSRMTEEKEILKRGRGSLFLKLQLGAPPSIQELSFSCWRVCRPARACAEIQPILQSMTGASAQIHPYSSLNAQALSDLHS